MRLLCIVFSLAFAVIATAEIKVGVELKGRDSNRRDLSAQVTVPADQYMVGDPALKPTIVFLGAYEIDKYEVTIGAFEDFAEHIKAHPDEEHKWDHPASDQTHVSHLTEEVKILIANARRRDARVFHDKSAGEPGIDIDLSCPMLGINWWTAYAYANWRGRELPTEEEWEVAARGARGFKYPWGDELKLGRMNSNDGFQPMKRGSYHPADGHNYWANVDKFTDDESPFQAIGMAGNVAEWVVKIEGKRDRPMVKGGSFATPAIPMFSRMDKLEMDDCWFVYPGPRPAKSGPARPGDADRQYVGDPITASTHSLYIGFRTVKHK